MSQRYFSPDGTVRPCSPRGPVGGRHNFNLAEWIGSEAWKTPQSEMHSTLRSTCEMQATTLSSVSVVPTTKQAGIKTAPAIDRIHARPTSPRKLADIRGNDIFADGERPDSVKPVSPRKAKELAGSMLKEIKASQALTPACAISTQRKRDNLLSVAFTSGEEELPVAAVSNYKKQHLSGNLPFPDEPVQLRTMRKMKPRMGQPLGIHEPLQWDPSCKVMEGPRVYARPSSGRHPVGGKCQISLG